MKKIIPVLIIIAIVASCSKNFLDENAKGSLTTEGFCKNKAELDMAVTAVYKAFSTTGYSEEITGMFCGSDDLTTRAGSNKENLRDFDMFFASKDKNVYNLDVRQIKWLNESKRLNCLGEMYNQSYIFPKLF